MSERFWGRCGLSCAWYGRWPRLGGVVGGQGRSEVTSGCKGEINALLEVIVCCTDEVLELRGTWDELARSLRFGCLTVSMDIDDVLNFVNCGREETGMLLDGGG